MDNPTFQDGSDASNHSNYNPSVDFYEDGDRDYLVSSGTGRPGQTWFFQHKVDGYTAANVGAGYGAGSGSSNNMLRIFPDVNTLYTGDANDVVNTSNGTISQYMEASNCLLYTSPSPRDS